jgi:hypothetical protein
MSTAYRSPKKNQVILGQFLVKSALHLADYTALIIDDGSFAIISHGERAGRPQGGDHDQCVEKACVAIASKPEC